MGSGLLFVPVHTDDEEYTLEGTLRSERPPALVNSSSFSQEGLFPSVLGANTRFLDLNITLQLISPKLLVLCRKASRFLEVLLEDQP